MEKEVLGFYITSHPMQVYHLPLRFFANCNVEMMTEALGDIEKNQRRGVRLGGQITKAEEYPTKSNPNVKYGRYTIEDQSGAYNFMLFRENFLKFHSLLNLNEFVMLYGTLSLPYPKKNGDEVIPPTSLELRITDVKLLDTLLEETNKTVCITLYLTKVEDDIVTEMKQEDMEEFLRVIKENPGKQNYKIHLVDAVGKKACNMTPVKGKKTHDTINAHAVLPLLEKMPFVGFDLR